MFKSGKMWFEYLLPNRITLRTIWMTLLHGVKEQDKPMNWRDGPDSLPPIAVTICSLWWMKVILEQATEVADTSTLNNLAHRVMIGEHLNLFLKI